MIVKFNIGYDGPPNPTYRVHFNLAELSDEKRRNEIKQKMKKAYAHKNDRLSTCPIYHSSEERFASLRQLTKELPIDEVRYHLDHSELWNCLGGYFYVSYDKPEFRSDGEVKGIVNLVFGVKYTEREIQVLGIRKKEPTKEKSEVHGDFYDNSLLSTVGVVLDDIASALSDEPQNADILLSRFPELKELSASLNFNLTH